MRRVKIICIMFAVLSGVIALFAPPAKAVPAYARYYGMSCSVCHTVWGDLNQNGATFKLSGYRRMNGRDLQPPTKDIELAQGALALPAMFPISIVTGAGFDYRTEKRTASDGSKSTRTGSSFNLEDISIFVTAPLGKHLSIFAEFPMYETKAWEFTPTGPAEAGDTKTHKNIQFPTENPTFEVAKAWWNSLLPTDWAPQDSLNALIGITHPPLPYPSGKVRLSVNQYLVYERRPLDLLSPKKLDDFLSVDQEESLFRLGEPQVLLELNGYLVPGGKPTDIGPPQTFWTEYHLGVTNGSNGKSDNNSKKDVYGRFVMRWWGQSLGVFGYYSPDTYDKGLRSDASIANGGIMSGQQRDNSTFRVGPDFGLSLAPWGIPVTLKNDILFNRDSDPTGFGKSFSWTGGFHEINWRVIPALMAYARYDWIRGNSYDDTAAGGITRAKPSEWDIVAGLQYLILDNVKVTGEYRWREFKNTLSDPAAAALGISTGKRLTENGFTIRLSFGF